MDLHTFLEYTF